jgi:hypothetical protein
MREVRTRCIYLIHVIAQKESSILEGEKKKKWEQKKDGYDDKTSFGSAEG